ncbi:MAG TPA: hypothetical protein VJ802_14350 [Gemmatimonadaceae bacterium]|nr:hypothetical protein [Gemmatimonadaceae bacterium]
MTHAHATASGESAALSRDLADFLIELSIALHKNAIYPSGHPLLAGAVDALVLRLVRLLQDRATLSLGVARQQLVIEGVVTAASNSLLRDLAQRLHRHHLGAVKFLRGIARDEVADLLKTIAADAERSVTPLGLRSAEELRRWAHIRAFPLTYDQLELASERSSRDAAGGGGSNGEAGARAAQLWVGLARAAMFAESAASTTGEVPSTDPVVVAKAIDEHRREVAYDQVIVGYLLQIAEELKRKGGAESLALQKRISMMVSALNPATLRRLLEMGGDLSQRRRFMLDAAQGMAVDAVMELVQAAADTSQQTISHSLVRLLTKLATHAEQGAAPELRAGAESELRDHVQRLIGDWTLDDPNPGNYRVVLDHMAKAAPLFATSEPSSRGPEPERIIQMSLELDSLGEPVTRAVEAMIGRGDLLRLFTLVSNAPERSRAAAAMWRQLASPEQLRTALREVPIDFTLVDHLVPRLKLAAADPLLDALEVSPSRAIRRKLLDLLVQLGPEVTTVITGRLPDERWFVVRNMLMLLADLGDQNVELGTSYARHADGRVRREAIRILVGIPATRERAICAGLDDGDERVFRVALQAASGRCPMSAVAILQRRVTEGTLDPELSSHAIAVIASVRTTEVLEWLMERAAGSSRRLFGRPRLAPKSPTMLAALNGLATHWARGRGVGAVLALALGSGDVEIRNTVIAAGHNA